MNSLKKYKEECDKIYNLYDKCFVEHLPYPTSKYLDREGIKFAINFCEKKYPYKRCKKILNLFK